MIGAALLCSLASLLPQEGLSPERFARKLSRLSSRPELSPDPTNSVADDERAARFGRALFFDPRLSPDERFSCATCHDPAKAFTDGHPLALGRETLTRNAPTLLDVGRRRWLFWDGRTDSLWAQVRHPLESALEMDGDRLALAHLIQSDESYRSQYEALFGRAPELADAGRFPAHAKPMPKDKEDPRHLAWERMTTEDRAQIDALLVNVSKSLAAYQRRLETGRSKFDEFASAYLAGDASGGGHLSAEARRGLGLFLDKGQCTLCHMGPELTDEEFHHLAVPPLNDELPIDQGRHLGAILVKREGVGGPKTQRVLEGDLQGGCVLSRGLRRVLGVRKRQEDGDEGIHGNEGGIESPAGVPEEGPPISFPLPRAEKQSGQACRDLLVLAPQVSSC